MSKIWPIVYDVAVLSKFRGANYATNLMRSGFGQQPRDDRPEIRTAAPGDYIHRLHDVE